MKKIANEQKEQESLIAERCWLIGEIENAVARNADFLQVKYKVNGVICKRTFNIDKWTSSNIPRRCEIIAESLNIENFEGFVKDDNSVELIYKNNL